MDIHNCFFFLTKKCRFILSDMNKAKSITFRCSDAQYRRLEKHMEQTRRTRTTLICEALECFLDFAEANRQLNLFELVEAVNARGGRVRFEDEA